MPLTHIYSPEKGLILNKPSTTIPKEASTYISGMYIKDGEVISDFGHRAFPSPGDTQTNYLHGTVMRIDQFFVLSGLSYLIAFTTTNAYQYNTGTSTWDNITQGATVEDCEDAWTANANVTSAVDSSVKLRGTNSVKNTIGASFTTGIAAYEDFASADLSGYTALHFWIRSDIATSAGDLQIVLDDTSGCTSPLESLNVPALTANTWTPVCVDFVTPGNLTAVISVGLKVVADNGAQIVHIDDVKAVKRFTGDEDNRFSTAAMNDTFIITNGVDQPQKYTGTGNLADLSTTLAAGSITSAELVFSFKDHLFLMSNIENGASVPQRVSWTNIGTIEDWINGTAGYQDLVDDESWIVGRDIAGENEVVIYKERSIVLMTWVGGRLPFRFITMAAGSGALSKEGITPIGGEHMVFGPDVIFAYGGEKGIDVIDDNVKKELYDRINDQYSNRVFLLYVEEDDELQVWIPTDGQYPDEVWTYNIVTEVWYKKKRQMTGFGYYSEQSSTTIGQLQGTIGEQTWTFGSRLVKKYSPITLLGDNNGKVYKIDKTTLNNDGTAIVNEFQTPDFIMPPEQTGGYMNRFMRVSQLLFECKGQSVTTEWSDDMGQTWYPTSSSGNNTTTLVSGYDVYQQDFDAMVRRIRFRFRNTSASSGFSLRYYGIKWKLRSERA